MRRSGNKSEQTGNSEFPSCIKLAAAVIEIWESCSRSGDDSDREGKVTLRSKYNIKLVLR